MAAVAPRTDFDSSGRPPTVLLCHNHYQQAGGEDQAFSDEAALLESAGHEVVRFTLHNKAIGPFGGPRTAAAAVWNGRSYRELRRLMRASRPAVMHCTNTFPLISPAAYYAAQQENVPVVQSLHNYRLLCPNALLYRAGRLCEECVGRWPWPGIAHGCYRNSRLASAAVAAMLGVHRALGTWTRRVSRYIALSEFSRAKFIAGGLPAARISVKPNCVLPDPGPGPGGGRYAVFVGRLSAEKGIDLLLDAWRDAPIGLRIVGDGPLAPAVRQAVVRQPALQWLGRRPHAETLEIIGRAEFLVVPSGCYENFPKAIVEAYAKGTPVIGARLGAMAELVSDGVCGLLFEPNHAAELAQKVGALVAGHDARARMRRAAREAFETRYSGARNYELLIDIYAQACGRRPPEPEAFGLKHPVEDARLEGCRAHHRRERSGRDKERLA